jgi:hypothetical protein
VRVDADADQPRLLEPDRVAVGLAQLVEGRPLLAGGLDVLALVLADGACGGRLVALGVLRPAGCTDEIRQVPTLRAVSLLERDGIDRLEGPMSSAPSF